MIKSLFKRSGVYFVGLSLGKALSVLVFILFARALLPAKFGDLVLYMTIGQIITFLGDFGLNQWYQKKAHTEGRSKLFIKLLNARILTLSISFIFSVVMFAFISTFSSFVVLIFLIALIPYGFLSVTDGYFFERNESFIVAAKTILRMVIFLLGYMIFKDNFTIETAVTVYLVGDIITLIWFFPWQKLRGFKFIPIRQSVKTLRDSFPYAFLVLTSFAYARGDSLVIRSLLESAALGIYGAAYRFLEGVSLLPTALSHNLFPLSAREHAVSLKQIMKMSYVMGLLGLVLSLFIYFSAPWFVPLLLSSAYMGAVPIVQIFSLVILLFFISAPLNTVVLSSNQVKKFLPFGIANTFLNIILNITLLPIYEIQAAAWVMFTTELTGLLINLYFVKKVYE